MPADMNSYGLTDSGSQRKENQDSILLNRHLRLYIVADGMGGHAHGELASRQAVTSINGYIQESLFNAPRQSLKRDEIIVEILARAIGLANREIYEYSRSLPARQIMGTTISLAFIANGRVYIGHIGDSRIYRLRYGLFEKMTKDHTEIQRLVDMGVAAEEEAENHGLSHVLTKALGAGPMITPDIHVLDEDPEDSLLLTTDGLFRVLHVDEVRHVLQSGSSPKQKCRTLIRKALERGAPDNVSVIVADPRRSGFFRKRIPPRPHPLLNEEARHD